MKSIVVLFLPVLILLSFKTQSSLGQSSQCPSGPLSLLVRTETSQECSNDNALQALKNRVQSLLPCIEAAVYVPCGGPG